jgi:hypothetical protein
MEAEGYKLIIQAWDFTAGRGVIHLSRRRAHRKLPAIVAVCARGWSHQRGPLASVRSVARGNVATAIRQGSAPGGDPPTSRPAPPPRDRAWPRGMAEPSPRARWKPEPAELRFRDGDAIWRQLSCRE